MSESGTPVAAQAAILAFFAGSSCLVFLVATCLACSEAASGLRGRGIVALDRPETAAQGSGRLGVVFGRIGIVAVECPEVSRGEDVPVILVTDLEEVDSAAADGRGMVGRLSLLSASLPK